MRTILLELEAYRFSLLMDGVMLASVLTLL